jgi:hypothetical protein
VILVMLQSEPSRRDRSFLLARRQRRLRLWIDRF